MLGVIHLLKKKASHPAGEKKSPSRFTLLSFSLSNYPFLSRGGDSAGDRFVLAPTPTKGLWCSGGRTEKSHRLPPWFLAMGGSSLGPELLTLQEKRGKRKREKIKQEIVRAKGKMLGCYSLIRSPFLWWSHLLREEEMRSAVQTLKHDPPWFHYCYWQRPCTTAEFSQSPDRLNTRTEEAPVQCRSALQCYLCEGDSVMFSCIETVREEIWCI